MRKRLGKSQNTKEWNSETTRTIAFFGMIQNDLIPSYFAYRGLALCNMAHESFLLPPQ